MKSLSGKYEGNFVSYSLHCNTAYFYASVVAAPYCSVCQFALFCIAAITQFTTEDWNSSKWW